MRERGTGTKEGEYKGGKKKEGKKKEQKKRKRKSNISFSVYS